MSDYRKEIGGAVRDGYWTFWKVLPLVVLVLVVLGGIGFALNSAGIIGKTAVERKVFENSYQRSESVKSQIATEEAALKEIELQLENPNLDADTRYNLEAQASAARVRLDEARRKQ